jgi:hypothetical protein
VSLAPGTPPGAPRGRERALGWLAVLIGLGLALAVQARMPVGAPLYDGVVVAEPYRYLQPTSADQSRDPTSASSTEDVAGNTSPVFAIATTEQPPQAQLIAQSDAFQLPPGTTTLQISIKPVPPEAQPTAGSIAGNVYRVAIANQSGAPVTPKSCDACLSLVLRTPPEVTEGTVAHLENGAWVEIATFHAGAVAMFQANAKTLGDFAVIAGSGAGPGGGSGGLDPLLFGGIALALFFAAVAGLFWYRRRPPPVPVARLGTGRGRIPSKRKAPRRPPSGRSGS